MKTAPTRLWIFIAILFFAGILKANLPQTVIGSWTAVANLSQARTNSTAVMLPDGRILFTGGEGANGPLQSSEVFNTNGVVSSAAAMNVARSRHFAVVLSDGRVLVGGGTSGGGTTNSVEIYDPAKDSWTPGNPMMEARANATASLLQDGRVVIAGGDNSGFPSSTVEIFDPASGNFSFAGTLSSPRTKHAMAVLQDGRVLIVGGFDGNNPLASSDIFDPASCTVSAGPSLATARYAHSATTLLDGRVVVIGGAGQGSSGTVDLGSAEIFDPATGVFSDAGIGLTAARQAHQAFLLPNNNSVLIFGGTAAGQVVPSSELFTPQASPADGSWSYAVNPTGANVTSRSGAAGSAMQQDGLLLAAGGNDAAGNALPSTELYAFPTVKTDASDYAPGTIVTITGSGWKPGETVTLTLVESPFIDTHPTMTAIADGNGNIFNNQFSPDIHDVNIRFFLTAVGSQSVLPALNTFTDAAGDTVSATVSCAPNPATAGSPTTCTATVQNIQSGAPNGFPQGAVTFSFSGTGTFSPANGICTVAQIGATNNSSCSVSLTPTIAANGNVKGNFNSADQNKWKNDVSPNFALTVNAPTCTVASIATQPTSQLITYGQNATFTSSANGSPVPSVQWQVSTNAGTTWTNLANGGVVSGVTTGSLTLTAPPVSLSGNQYRAVFTNTCNGTQTVNSNAATLTVNKASVTATVTANDQTYDGTTTATQKTCTLSGVLAVDTGNVMCSASTLAFTDKNVGAGKIVNVSGITLSGSPAGNYQLSSTTATTTANITTAAITATLTAQDKAYDGTNTEPNANMTCSFTGVLAADSVNVTCTPTNGTFNTSQVATANQVTATVTLGGTAAGNYTLGAAGTNISSTSAMAAAHIKTVTVTATVIGNPTKPYDGNTNATLTSINFSLSGLVGTDSFTVNQTAGTYNSKDVATANSVSASLTAANFTAVGTTSANNYTLPTTASGPGHITVVTVNATVIGNPTKPYDGNTNATLTSSNFSQSGLIGGENFTVTKTSGTYNSKDVVSATTVNVTLAAGDFTATGGASAGNYSLPNSASGAGRITALSLNAAIIGNPSRPYDGTTSATLTSANFQLMGLVTGESITVNQIAGTYNSKDVLAATTVSASLSAANFSAGVGTLLTNYVLPNSASGAGQITARPLTVTATGVNKVYDGTATATVSLSDDRVSGDVFNVAYTTASFADKNVGMGKPVSVSGISISGADSGNYILQNTTANTTADITQRSLTVSATGVNKVYDGTNFATVTLSDDRVAGDVVTDNYTSASFNDKNVANGKSVSVSGISISGTDSGNYHLQNTTASTMADITARPLTITATGVNKVYDGTQTATVTLSDDRLAGDVFTDSCTSASFTDKNVGMTKPISVIGISISGTDSGNYTFNTTASATADITARHITVTAMTDSKTYDGNTTSTAVPTVTYGSLAPGDSANFTQSFDSRNAGARVLTASGSVSDGNSGNNYAVTFKTANGTILQLAITVTAVSDTKTYDATVTSSGTPTISPALIGPDSSGFNQAFDSKNAGARTLTPSGSVNDGNSGQNYAVTFKTAVGMINTAPLTITAVTNTKTYDGGTSALATPTATGLQVSDTVTNLSEKYTDSNAGTGKILVVNAGFIVNDGNNGNNYTVGTVNNTTGVINKANATIVVTPYNVTYNGSAHTATGSATGVVSENLAGLDLSATTHTNAGNYTDSWIFTDVNGNYYNGNGIVNDVIGKANATVNVTPYNVAYDGNSHTATGSAKGVLNESLSGLNLSGTTHTNPGDYPSDSWAFTDATGNYNNSNGTVHDSIGYGTCNAGFGPGQVILPPINSDGTSVYQRKGGSTIPVKFRVCTASGTPISNPSLVFAGTGGTLTMLSAVRGTIDSVNENSSTDIPDVAFRWDSSGQQWMFNMATTNLTSGSTDTFQINLAYGNIRFVVGVK